ncbi:D-alanyl-D-alanine dipeptidase [Methylobacterium iners]|uniref:D-alanyl-D-alanine dipeptidase n=1 Tax=Methylobacterium iners TaxID=418707 RepID=A0ABQ4RV53_9HYPH|nr:D-alanyl-D-alanine dipeptidase [Methylobacterium iners]
MARGRRRCLVSLFLCVMASDVEAKNSSPLVDAGKLVPDLRLEMRYAGAHNFMGRPVPGYEAPKCLLTREASQALEKVQAAIRADGYGLKVFDCYRPKRAVSAFVKWADDPKDLEGKAEFYPEIDKKDLFRLGYIARESSHSRGSTVDLTMFDLSNGEEVDMGSAFDLFSPRSNFAHGDLSPQARANRARLRAAMEQAGFQPYALEWWHFTLKREPFPDSAFDVPIR